jgi:hypothetical protein
MQNQKSKITYWVNGETVTEQEFVNLTGEYFKYFEGSDVKAVDYSSVESLFDGDYKSKRQINDHLQSVLGGYKKPNVKINSTRHKAREEGKFHKEPCNSGFENLGKFEGIKDDVIISSNRGEKEMIEKFKEILVPFKNGSEQMKVRVCSPQCLCDGSCKKEIKEPFSIQIPKPNPFNQYDFFDKKQSEQEILNMFKRNMDRIEGVKESQSVKKAPIFTYCKVNSLALEALAFRALYGHEKYKESDFDWQNFSRVPNAEEEYSNSMLRHALNIGEDETEEQHLIASAWNAVARLEVFLRNKKKKDENFK